MANLWLRTVSGYLGGLTLGTVMICTLPMMGDVERDRVVALECDNLVTPLGIDDMKPRFAWQMTGARRGARQVAYEVMVGSGPEALKGRAPDVWDSGRVSSGASVDVAFAGNALAPRHRYYWQVKVWNELGEVATSPASWWETGLLMPEDWHSKWVANDSKMDRDDRAANPSWIWTKLPVGAGEKPDPRVQFRKHVELAQRPAEANLLISAKDSVSAYVNGDDVMKGGTCVPFESACPWGTFQQIDVTSQLHQGANLLAVEASVQKDAKRRGGLLALLTVKLADGSYVRFGSGDDWKSARGQKDGWYAPGFDDAGWSPSTVVGHIGDIGNAYPWPPRPASEFRKEFESHGKVVEARLYATALGTYIPYLNGKRVGKEILAPGWTDYKQELLYQTYDVTAMVEKGANVLGVMLGDGWYASGLVNTQRRYGFGAPPLRFMAQLEVSYEDGTKQTVVSDESWRVRQSPILRSDIYNGEIYDARLEDKNWASAKDSAAGWGDVTLAESPGAAMKISAQAYPPIRVEMELKPKSIAETAPGVFLIDMGQDMVGGERISARGTAGQKIKLQFGEVLNDDGTFYRDNMRSAAEEDDFTLKGDGEETFEPSFTYHGFRYIQVSNYPGKLKAEDIAGLVFHTDAPFTMSFHTSNAIIDKLVTNIEWGQRGNFMSVPTDCPQRDERLGWMGDAEVFWRTASYNMDLASFSRKFGEDMRTAQTADGQYTDVSPRVLQVAGQGTPGWADAGIVIPWTAYSQFGDTKVLEQSWNSMVQWMEFQKKTYPNYIVDKKGYGDWLAIDSVTEPGVIGTAFYAYDAGLMSKIATALGKTKEAAFYDEELKKIAAAFQAKFVHADGTIGNGSQTSDVLALRMGLVPEELRLKTGDALVADIQKHNGHLTTGFLGTPYLMPVLTNVGHADAAFDLLTQDSYPSWEYMIKHGATTMWERWNGNQMLGDPGMNSFNHYAYGAVGEWLYQYVAGIDFDAKELAFHAIVFHPHFSAKLGDVDATYDSAYGPIRSSWKLTGSDVAWTVTVPANASAVAMVPRGVVHVADGEGKDARLMASSAKDGGSEYALTAGMYVFSIHLQ